MWRNRTCTRTFLFSSGNGIKFTFLSVKTPVPWKLKNRFSFKLKNLRIFRVKIANSFWCTVIIVSKMFVWIPAVAGVPNVVGFPIIAEISAVVHVMVFLASLLLLHTMLLLVSLLLLASVPCLVLIAVVGVLVANVSPDCCCWCSSPWFLFAYSYMLLPWHALILVESLLCWNF